MREIKFRAWDKEDKTMSVSFEIGSILSENTIDKIFLQYTGLKDRNGKEIYDGDIVKDQIGEKSKIEWQGVGWNPIDHYKLYRFEIIGNIYENPEVTNA